VIPASKSGALLRGPPVELAADDSAGTRSLVFHHTWTRMLLGPRSFPSERVVLSDAG
jgi:hypothetical protein